VKGPRPQAALIERHKLPQPRAVQDVKVDVENEPFEIDGELPRVVGREHANRAGLEDLRVWSQRVDKPAAIIGMDQEVDIRHRSLLKAIQPTEKGRSFQDQDWDLSPLSSFKNPS
jgi:hypothetical protein